MESLAGDLDTQVVGADAHQAGVHGAVGGGSHGVGQTGVSVHTGGVGVGSSSIGVGGTGVSVGVAVGAVQQGGVSLGLGRGLSLPPLAAPEAGGGVRGVPVGGITVVGITGGAGDRDIGGIHAGCRLAVDAVGVRIAVSYKHKKNVNLL